jgi:glycosyltransferase involved in cell wall biosynthesis
MSLPKVLHLVPAPFGLDGIFGGGERYALELAKTMARRLPTRLVSFGSQSRRTIHVGGLEEVVLGKAWNVRSQRTNPYHSGIFRHIWWADVVHCHQNHTFSAEVAALFSRVTRKKVYASDLGGGGWGLNGYMKTDLLFTGHLHISEYSRNFGGHAHSDRAAVIYGGVDTFRFFPDRAVTKDPLVVFVGRVMPHKGVDNLIRALPDGLTLEVIGRPYNSEYQAMLTKLAVGKAVHFRSGYDDDEVIQAYRRAICVVLPSLYRDCYGNQTRIPELLGQTLLEGMACGVAGLCTQVASLPEVVEDGISGYVVQPNDPDALGERLRTLRDDPILVAKMGHAARHRVLTRFTWDAVVDRCFAAYGVAGVPSSAS